MGAGRDAQLRGADQVLETRILALVPTPTFIGKAPSAGARRGEETDGGMARQRVRFDYHTGLRRDAFDAAELTGS